MTEQMERRNFLGLCAVSVVAPDTMLKVLEGADAPDDVLVEASITMMNDIGAVWAKAHRHMLTGFRFETAGWEFPEGRAMVFPVDLGANYD